MNYHQLSCSLDMFKFDMIVLLVFFFRLTKRIIVHVIWNYYQLSRPFEQALKTLLQCFLGNRAACVKHKGLHSNNKKSKKSY